MWLIWRSMMIMILSFNLNNEHNHNTVVLLLVSFSGVRLRPLGTSATVWPTVPALNDRWWWMWSSRWNENWEVKLKYSEKTCPSATLSTTNPTWPDLGSNPGCHGGKPATNHLSYGTAYHNTVRGNKFTNCDMTPKSQTTGVLEESLHNGLYPTAMNTHKTIGPHQHLYKEFWWVLKFGSQMT
jgi:hypothetical protein